MEYYVHMNDSRFTLIPGRFIALTDNNTKEVNMRVSFDVDGNQVVCMTTSKDLTYMSTGKEKSLSTGDKIVFPLNHVVILITGSAHTPRIKVRVVKLDDPRSPTPPPEGIPSTLPTTPEPEAPAPAPPQAQKRQKRQKREFHMLA